MTNTELFKDIQYRIRNARRDCQALHNPSARGIVMIGMIDKIEELVNDQLITQQILKTKKENEELDKLC